MKAAVLCAALLVALEVRGFFEWNSDLEEVPQPAAEPHAEE